MTRLLALEDLAWDYIKFSYAPGSYSNMVTKRKRYMEFCCIFQLTPFPITQWQIVRFATYLSLWFRSVQSIKNYVSGICMLQELNGFDKVVRGTLYKNVIRGIRRELCAVSKQAEPITRDMLREISQIIDVTDFKQLSILVCILFGFNLFLRKGNLVPDLKQHEPDYQLSRRDIRFDRGVLVAHIKWSKTNQFGEKPLFLPMMINKESDICPVKWCLYMINKVPAKADHNLFSYRDLNSGAVLPVTYTDLTKQLRVWLATIGVKEVNHFSSHSLRRGGATTAFENGVPEITIKTLGNWASSAYRRYIECTLNNRLKAWMLFNNF